jgi:REP-associated tyrosine transposase
MPRQARLDVPGALHHVMVRGINKSAIFKDDEDRSRFLERLGKNGTEGKCCVYAWVLISNHAHILFKSTSPVPIELTRRMNSSVYLKGERRS